MDINYVNTTGEVQFTAVTKSMPGANISRVVIEIMNAAQHTIEYRYIVIVVGYQPENTWVDLVSVNLPNDNALNPLNRHDTEPPILACNQDFTYASKTKFTSGSYQLVSFISSIFLYSNWPFGVGISMNGYVFNSTNFWVQYRRTSSSTSLITLYGTIVVYDSAAIKQAGGLTLQVPLTLRSGNWFNYGHPYQNWGPNFDSKCIVGYNNINYYKP
jgi:hypothetical protein